MARPHVLLVLLVLLSAGCTGPADEEAAVSSVTLEDIPSQAAPGEDVQVCWRVEGIGRTSHTDLHVSNESHPSLDLHRGDSIYPSNEAKAASQGYRLPDRFCAEVTMPPTGSLYVLAHAVDEQNQQHRLSHQRLITPIGAATDDAEPT